jgi:acyl-CoA thioester hydrolase
LRWRGDALAAVTRQFHPCCVSPRFLTHGSLTDGGFVNKVHCTMSTYVIDHEDVVRPEWIDSNGHMNLAFYVVAFDYATDKLYSALGIGDAYRAASNFSCFTVETHTLYERELLLGEKLVVRSMILGADTKRVHYFHEMFHVESGERAATQELLALHIDMSIRRVAPFPEDRQAALAESVKRFKPAVLPKGAGRKIGLPA